MIKALAFVYILFSFPQLWALSMESIEQNNEGVDRLKIVREEKQKELKDKEYKSEVDVSTEAYDAYQNFVQALKNDPLNNAIHLNLGMSYEYNEEAEKALKEYEFVIKNTKDDKDMQFIAYFNAAKGASNLKNIDLALKYYQKALEIVPESKEVKTNIELLWQQGKGKGKGDKDGGKGDEKSPDGKEGENNENQNYSNKPQEKKPKPFDSRQLSKNDVRKILEEIKNQEQKIRAKEYKKGAKEKPSEKNW